MNKTLKFALKLFLMLLFVSFAGMMLIVSFTVIFMSSPKWVAYMFTQVFGIAILVTMMWQTAYMTGFRDSNMVRTGHMKENLFKGFLCGGLAQIPFLLFLILSIVFNLRFAIYRFLNGAYYWMIVAIGGSAAESEAAICMRDIGVWRNALLFLPLLIAPAITGIVYILGYKGIDISSKLLYKKRKENK